MIVLLVITDGRQDCISQTIPSAVEHLHGPITRRLIYDDSGQATHRQWLNAQFGPHGFEVLFHQEGRQGFGGAINAAWRYVDWMCDEPYIFHLEDDFTFNRPVPLTAMIDVLEHRALSQIVLRRQPWGDEPEGGYVAQWPQLYKDHDDALGRRWLEHRVHWSTNPSLYHRRMVADGWPTDQGSEGKFGRALFDNDTGARVAVWGARHDEPWVTHIGHQRVGTGY